MGDTSDAEEEKEDFGNALKKCNSMAERRQMAVTRVMNMRGVTVDGWKQDAFDGAFAMLAANAKVHAAKKEEPARVLNGKKVIRDKEAYKNGNAIPKNNFERIRQAIKAKNSRPEGAQEANIIARLLNALEARK